MFGMKMKKINSIGYGGKILGFAAVFTLLIPGILKLIMLVYKSSILAICATVSFGIGIIITFFFCALLTVEFHQDKKQNLHFEAQKNVKLNLGNGRYECQSCGNKTVTSEDKDCSICGILFKDKGE